MMKLSTLLAIAAALGGTDAFQILSRPKVEDAAVYARTLISRESLANLNTVYQKGDDEGLPTSFVEYYADCGDGNPVILAVDMATSFKNVAHGSKTTLTVRVGDHPGHEEVDPEYPGSRPRSVAGSPRVNLRGKFVPVSDEEAPALKQCFLARHKDAGWWLPGNPIHKSHWVKFEVDDVYFLGGFGDTGYIGKIPAEMYHNATALEDKPHHKGERPTAGHRKAPHHQRQQEQEQPEDWSVQAVHAQRTIERMASDFVESITSQLDTLGEYLNSESQEDVVIVLDEEEPESIVEIFRSKLSKRDKEVPEKIVNLKYLTNEQVAEIINELTELKSELEEYTKQFLSESNKDSDESKQRGPKSKGHGPKSKGKGPKHEVTKTNKGPKSYGGDKFEGNTEHKSEHREPKFVKIQSNEIPKPHHREFEGESKPHHREFEGESKPHHRKVEGESKPHHREFEGESKPHHREEKPHGDSNSRAQFMREAGLPENHPSHRAQDERRPHNHKGLWGFISGWFSGPKPCHEGKESKHDSQRKMPHVKPGVYSSEEIFVVHHPGMEASEEIKGERTVVLVNQEVEQ